MLDTFTGGCYALVVVNEGLTETEKGGRVMAIVKMQTVSKCEECPFKTEDGFGVVINCFRFGELYSSEFRPGEYITPSELCKIPFTILLQEGE